MQLKQKDCQACALRNLCLSVRMLVQRGDYEQALDLCRKSLAEYPDSPVEQNLIGVVDELKGRKTLALRHFAASSALGPGYCPAIHNLDVFGEVFGSGKPAFDDEDCKQVQNQDDWKVTEKDGIKYLERKQA